ncbi:Mfa1 family fimbria major subunit [Parabacteroides sp.]
MRNKLSTYIYRLLIYPIISLLGSCSSEFSMDEPSPNNEGPSVYINLRIATEGRAGTGSYPGPIGGENGDGYEEGTDNESKVENLTVFFFEGGNKGVNAEGNTPIVATLYVDQLTKTTDQAKEPYRTFYQTGPQKIEKLTADTYDLIAVANAGNFNEQANLTTLGAVRDYLFKDVWKESGGSYSQFIMSSEEEARITGIQNAKTETTAATATIHIERLAARVDFNTPQKSYEINKDNLTEATAKITRILLVNEWDGNTYLLKRVADDIPPTSLAYLGDEETNNYVISDKTAVKYLHKFDVSLKNSWTTESKGVDDLPKIKTENNGKTWLRLGYVRENTAAKETPTKEYATGVIFEASYTPTGFTEGETFFRYDGRLYPTLEAVITAFGQSGLKDALEAYVTDLGNSELDDSHRTYLYDHFGIEAFLYGLCYYTYWIRHNGGTDGATTGLPMEFAIVRNNIYRLSVSQIASLGSNEPGKENGNRIIIAVERWKPLDPEVVPFDQ